MEGTLACPSSHLSSLMLAQTSASTVLSVISRQHTGAPLGRHFLSLFLGLQDAFGNHVAQWIYTFRWPIVLQQHTRPRLQDVIYKRVRRAQERDDDACDSQQVRSFRIGAARPRMHAELTAKVV
jgi:hypothetical protein